MTEGGGLGWRRRGGGPGFRVLEVRVEARREGVQRGRRGLDVELLEVSARQGIGGQRITEERTGNLAILSSIIACRMSSQHSCPGRYISIASGKPGSLSSSKCTSLVDTSSGASDSSISSSFLRLASSSSGLRVTILRFRPTAGFVSPSGTGSSSSSSTHDSHGMRTRILRFFSSRSRNPALPVADRTGLAPRLMVGDLGGGWRLIVGRRVICWGGGWNDGVVAWPSLLRNGMGAPLTPVLTERTVLAGWVAKKGFEDEDEETPGLLRPGEEGCGEGWARTKVEGWGGPFDAPALWRWNGTRLGEGLGSVPPPTE